MSKCPYCFRPIGTWKKDPILLTDGAIYQWKPNTQETELEYVSDIEDRIYKGIYQITIDELIELQDHRKSLEEELLPEVDRTEFSPINDTGKFQITVKHIEELRESTEKLLIAMGITKEEYFNYDEDMNHIIHPLGDKSEWTEPNLEADKFQCKNIHIEDLRHNIPSIWIETWTEISSPIDKYTHVEGEMHGGLVDELWDIFTCDHIWRYNVAFTQLYAAGSGDQGVVKFMSTSTYNLSSGINWTGYGYATPIGYASEGTGRGHFRFFHDLTQIIKITPNTKIKIENLNFIRTYTFGSLTHERSKLSTYARLIINIKLSNGRYMNYFFGRDNATPPPFLIPNIKYSIYCGDNYSGIFDRNLYDDYTTIHGSSPSAYVKIDSIRFECRYLGYTYNPAHVPPQPEEMWATVNTNLNLGILKVGVQP